MSFFSRPAVAALLAGVLSIGAVHAQQDTTTNNPAGTGTVTRYDDGHARGFDWGWLGLLGLFGLLGLRKPTQSVYQDRDRTYQDRTTTSDRRV